VLLNELIFFQYY